MHPFCTIEKAKAGIHYNKRPMPAWANVQKSFPHSAPARDDRESFGIASKKCRYWLD
jgi:hypothetical protein